MCRDSCGGGDRAHHGGSVASVSYLHAPSLLHVVKPRKLSGPWQAMDEDASSSY